MIRSIKISHIFYEDQNQNLDRDIVEASLWKPNKNPNNLKQGETFR